MLGGVSRGVAGRRAPILLGWIRDAFGILGDYVGGRATGARAPRQAPAITLEWGLVCGGLGARLAGSVPDS